MSVIDGIKAAVKTGVDYLSSSGGRAAWRTATAAVDNSQVLRGARQTLFPNLANTNMDPAERIGLSKTLIALSPIAAAGIGVATVGTETFKPQPAPPPSAYYDGSGDLRHVNDMGAGPGFARSVMGRQ